MPLVSVIIPTYNRRDLLINRALPSVWTQTRWPDQEVIVVGDGTDQATVDAVIEEQRHHEELRFWNLKHYDYPDEQTTRWGLVGLYAINFGIDQAQGDWIAVLGDDDEFTPDHHEILLAAAERTGADHVYGISDTYKNGKRINQQYGTWPPGDGALANGANLWRRSLGYRFALDCWDRGHTGDADMWNRMYADGVKFHFEPKIVHKYHRNWP
jgi:glycosyltransferase involved in cell wall biosynthesis